MPSSHGEPGEEQPLDEIKELLRSADIDWLADVVQHRAVPSAHSYLGKGKMEDLKTMVRETGATVAVCEDDLTPAQVAAVLDAVESTCSTAGLILTVFSRHAHSLKGTLQVHLAQLEFELTRMRGKGLILSRLGARVDMRGPGETSSRSTAASCAAHPDATRAHRASGQDRRTQRARRLSSAVPLIALAGYTNAGKSTLLNALTDADVSVRDRLFETLDPTSRHTATGTATTSSPTPSASSASCRTASSTRSRPRSEETTLADVVLVVGRRRPRAAEIGARERTVSDASS